jgi:thymidylate synthase
MGKSYQQQYAEILRKLIFEPQKQTPSRVGNVRSRFVETIRVNIEKEFPLMEIKKVSFKNIATELLWFINGETNIKYLVDNGCNIWNDDAYRFYKEKFSPFRFDNYIPNESNEFNNYYELTKEEFIEKVKLGERIIDKYVRKNEYLESKYAWINTSYKYGDMGRIYGFQWRSFNGASDQLLSCIETLKTNPDDRRMIVTGHNPTDLESRNVALPSCHNYFQFYTTPLTTEERKNILNGVTKDVYQTDEQIHEVADKMNIPTRKLSVYYNIRSNDFFLGQPYNTPSYALLLQMVSKVVNMIPSEVVCNAIDCHLYEKHLDAAKVWLERYDDRFHSDNSYDSERESLFTYCSSSVKIKRQIKSIDEFSLNDFELRNYAPDKSIKAPLLT